MKACSVAVLLLLVWGVFAQRQPQQNLYPIIADGFETVWLDDMSFVTEIHLQTFPPNNFTFFIFGSNNVRTVYPQEHGYYVGSWPNENWHLPFIDLHTVQVGQDIWGFGPIESFLSDDPNQRFHPNFGYELQVALITTKQGEYFRFQPLGFEGTFFSVRPIVFPGGSEVLGYFAGFFADPFTVSSGLLHFGVLRAWLNISAVSANPQPPNTTAWVFNPRNDIAILVNQSQLITYNAYYKPHIYHVWNVTGDPNPNTTYTIVIPPGGRDIFLAYGSLTPNTSLTVPNPPLRWIPPPNSNLGGLGVSSTAYYYPYHNIILGLAVPGLGTGAIAFIHAYNLSTRGILQLPANYSDPKALVVDEFNGTLYVAMNGGGAVLQISIHHMNITGYQRTPPYLARAWAGQQTPGHVYFVTNEQHSKVFRVSKHDFCPTECLNFGYCQRGQCICAPGFTEQNGQCQWAQLVKDQATIKKDTTGEAVLGVFFAIAVVTAAAGWYMVYRGKKQGYQAV